MDSRPPSFKPPLSHAASGLIGEKDAIALSAEQFIARSLRRWVIRTIIGAALFTFITLRWSWGKWALLVWIPLSLLSLAMILYSRHILRTKSSAIEDKIRSAHRDDTTP